jgi:uncharacterized protein DUF2490
MEAHLPVREMTRTIGARDSSRFNERMKQRGQSSSDASEPRALKRTKFKVQLPGWLLFLLSIAAALPLGAADDDLGNEYRLTLSPNYPIKGNFSGFGELGYHWNPERDAKTYTILWPGLTYHAAPWAQLSGGLRSSYADSEESADRLELRPFAGVKLSLPNEFKWQLYNYTRYEFRDTQDRDTHDWTGNHRLRSRFGAAFPLTAREKAWQPKTWYGLADVEPFYRFDTARIDPLVVRGGIGYVLNDRIRLEFIYYAAFRRPAGSSGLEYTDNIFRLNIKIALGRGILQRVFEEGDADN